MAPTLRTHIKSGMGTGAICGARTVGAMGILIRLEFVDHEPTCKRCTAALQLRAKARRLFQGAA